MEPLLFSLKVFSISAAISLFVALVIKSMQFVIIRFSKRGGRNAV